MNASQALEGALELLEQGWTIGAFARTEDGTPTTPDNPAARSFCARGAIYCAAQGDLAVNAKATSALEETIGGPTIAWNDNPKTTISDVRMTFRRAIGSKAMSESLVAA